MIKFVIYQPVVPAYYFVRGKIKKVYTAIIKEDDIILTLNVFNNVANESLADLITN